MGHHNAFCPMLHALPSGNVRRSHYGHTIPRPRRTKRLPAPVLPGLAPDPSGETREQVLGLVIGAGPDASVLLTVQV